MSERSQEKPLVVITGASQGIGEAIAHVFAAHPPVRLALLARNLNRLEEVRRALPSNGVEAMVVGCDVTDETQVAAAAETIITKWGAPSVLINNAGKFVPGPFTSYSLADFDLMLSTNLRSAFLVTQAFLPLMVSRGRGHIFMMGSVAGLHAYPGGTGYCAAKFGLTGLTKVLREELKKTGVKVTLVSPGPTVTPSWDGSGVPEERMMPPEDIARAILSTVHLSSRTVVEDLVLLPQEGAL